MYQGFRFRMYWEWGCSGAEALASGKYQEGCQIRFQLDPPLEVQCTTWLMLVVANAAAVVRSEVDGGVYKCSIPAEPVLRIPKPQKYVKQIALDP